MRHAPNTLQQALDLYDKEQEKIKGKVDKPKDLQIINKENSLLLEAPSNVVLTGQENKFINNPKPQQTMPMRCNENIPIRNYPQNRSSGPVITPPNVQNFNTTPHLNSAQPTYSNVPNSTNIKPEILFKSANSTELQAQTTLAQKTENHQSSVGQVNCYEVRNTCNSTYLKNNEAAQQPNQQNMQPPPPFQNRARNSYGNENNTIHNMNNNPLNDVTNISNFDYDLARPGTSHGTRDHSAAIGNHTSQGPINVKKARKNPYNR